MNTEAQNDPFDQLFVDQDALDHELVTEIILPHLRLQRNTTEVILTLEGSKLNLSKRVLVYLLARKVFVAKDVTEEEGASPAQIEKDTGIKGSSLRPTLSRLIDDKLVLVDKDTRAYSIPNYAIYRIADLLKKEDNVK